jgi:hypothetical protein
MGSLCSYSVHSCKHDIMLDESPPMVNILAMLIIWKLPHALIPERR